MGSGSSGLSGGKGSGGGVFSAQISQLQTHPFIDDAFVNPIPLSDNADRATRLYGDLDASAKPDVMELNLLTLKSAQDFIYRQPLESTSDSSAPITVLDYRGDYMVLDGNHRALKALWRGDKRIKANVYHL